MADTEPRKTLQQSLRETWMSALGVIGGAEGSAARAAHRVLEAVGLGGQGASTVAGELAERWKQNRAVIERRIDEGVKSAVARVRQPIVQEIASLRGRVEKLQRSVEELARRRAKK
jgi:hypothetical protein